LRPTNPSSNPGMKEPEDAEELAEEEEGNDLA
jgi:hypothetical protein